MKMHPLHRATQLPVAPSQENSFSDEGTHVVAFDDFAKSLIGGYSHKKNSYFYEDFRETAESFFEKFEFVEERKDFLSNPEESFNDQLNMMRVIRRKSDGALFGYEYCNSLGKYEDEESLEDNGEKHGIAFDFPDGYWDSDESYFPFVCVFTPVKPFTITGYESA